MSKKPLTLKFASCFSPKARIVRAFGEKLKASCFAAAKTKPFPPEIHGFFLRDTAGKHHNAGKQVTARGRDPHTDYSHIPRGHKQNIHDRVGYDKHTDTDDGRYRRKKAYRGNSVGTEEVTCNDAVNKRVNGGKVLTNAAVMLFISRK